MHCRDRIHATMIVISVIILILLVLYVLRGVSLIQGNAYVINYAAMVRGATQRLIKQELVGTQNPAEISRLDNILEGLSNGNEALHLVKLDDPIFHDHLSILQKKWGQIKELINASRTDPSQREALYTQSERYYALTEETVRVAEDYSANITANLKTAELLIAIDIVFVISLFSVQIYDEFRLNRRLKSIAYIDPNTGLPNKRSCEDILADSGVIPTDQVVCCLMFDLNNLKVANDTLGHKAGDVLISSFATVLRRSAPQRMFVGRYGGDEFVGHITNTSRPEIEAFIETLKQNVYALNHDGHQNGIRISFAYGFSISNENAGSTLKTLLDLADANMYKNKAECQSHHRA